MLPDVEVKEVDQGGEGFGVRFIEEDGVVGTDVFLDRLGVKDDLIVKMEGVNQLVDEDFEVLFPAKEDDLAILVSLLFRRLEKSNTTIHLFWA